MVGNSMNFSPERQPIKELKVQNMHKSSSKNFQPEPQPNSEQKADNISVCPTIANALVVRRFEIDLMTFLSF